MALPHPLVVIQSICTTWTKASRGGVGASARNRTPDALELPALAFPFPEPVFLLHEVIYTERDRFQHPMEKLEQRERADPFWYDCLKLELRENALRVMLEWERSEGVPRRSAFPRTAWSLQEDQWGRVNYNLRTPGEDCWIYKKRVLSIGFFHAYAPRMFLEVEPAHSYRDMAQLR